MEDQVTKEQLVEAVAQRVRAGSGIANLAKAFVGAYAEIDNVVKNANNPHFGSNYADLSAVLDTIRPVFGKHKLALLQAPGEIEGDKIALLGMLMHESGESVNFKMHVPIGKATAQSVGSALTYGRRYQASAVAGIAQVDDDGNAASEQPSQRKAPAPEKRAAQEMGGLMERIAAASSLASLEALKEEVKAARVTELSEAYLARKKTLKETA